MCHWKLGQNEATAIAVRFRWILFPLVALLFSEMCLEGESLKLTSLPCLFDSSFDRFLVNSRNNSLPSVDGGKCVAILFVSAKSIEGAFGSESRLRQRWNATAFNWQPSATRYCDSQERHSASIHLITSLCVDAKSKRMEWRRAKIDFFPVITHWALLIKRLSARGTNSTKLSAWINWISMALLFNRGAWWIAARPADDDSPLRGLRWSGACCSYGRRRCWWWGSCSRPSTPPRSQTLQLKRAFWFHFIFSIYLIFIPLRKNSFDAFLFLFSGLACLSSLLGRASLFSTELLTTLNTISLHHRWFENRLELISTLFLRRHSRTL